MLYLLRVVHLGALGVDQIGGKAQGLCWLQETGFRVPHTWVLGTEAFDMMIAAAGLAGHVATLQEATACRLDWLGMEQILQSLEGVRSELVAGLLNEPLPGPVTAALRRLPKRDPYWAVRSSASVEDGVVHSFAGQFSSFLSVPGGDPLIQAVREVWASAFGKAVLHYRAHNRTAMPHMAVILQPMDKITERDCSGVIFSQSPLPGEPGTLIQATLGAGVSVVSDGAGEIKCVNGSRVKTLGRTISQLLVTSQEGGLEAVPSQEGDVLPDPAAVYLANQVQQMASLYGRPVDVEFIWPYDNAPTFLQVRPISRAA